MICDNCKYKYNSGSEFDYYECRDCKYSDFYGAESDNYEKMPEHETIEKLREALNDVCEWRDCDCQNDCQYGKICKGNK